MNFTIENPDYLLLILPLGLLILFLTLKQSKSVKWILEKVSPRFRKDLTVYNLNSLNVQFFLYFFMGVLLCFGYANPIKDSEQEVEVRDKGTIIFALDGSLSMLAGDTSKNPITKLKPYDRFAMAQDFASDIVDLFPDYKYGLITFSGETSVHSMPISNPIEIKKLIRTSLVHNF
ncbi:MAG: VWA domain-containing protein, partial [Leptospiraceae bacterium]|nr:VWA domain-containing protein [Leptospiraceae bacterium]